MSIRTDFASATVPGTNTLVDIDSTGSQASTYGASSGALSANGQYVAYSSLSPNIVSGDTNSVMDTFVKNLDTGSTQRVSVSSSGVQADANVGFNVISSTGRYILFSSQATNLIDGSTVTTSYNQLYLRDTKMGTTTLLSKNSSSALSNASVKGDGVSSDGRFVLFETTATNLGPSVTNTSTANLYMLDRSSGAFTLLNYRYDGTLPNSTWAPTASMSCDGSLIAFQYGTALTTSSSSHVDTYLLDLRSGNKLTNLTYSANGAALNPTISCNGDYVGFHSPATNITTPTGTAGTWHAYAYDRVNEAYTVADQQGGSVGNSDACTIVSSACSGKSISISDTGVVVFVSAATNLSTAATSGTLQTYIYSLRTGNTELLSRNSSGTVANQASVNSNSIAAKGNIATLASYGTNLVSTSDTNGATDIFTSLTGY